MNSLKDLCHALTTTANTGSLEEDEKVLKQLLGDGIDFVTSKQESVRIIVSSNRIKADHTRQLVRECNGVVFAYPSWKLLVIPPPMMNIKFSATEVANNISSYKIYKITDGTIVNLYHHGGSWRISSANGYDVSDYRWFGDITYAQAIDEVLTLYPEFSYNNLNKDYSYTIGFRHHAFHPFTKDPQCMWLVAANNLTTFEQSMPDIGLPFQQLADLPASLEGKDLFKWMEAKNTEALKQFVSTMGPKAVKRQRATPLPNPADVIHYGYILRGNNGANSNIVLESELLSTIRKMMYNVPKQRPAGSTKIDHTNRMEYLIMRAYLGAKSRYVFLTLFEQFKPFYAKFDLLFQRIADRVIGTIRGKQELKTGPHGYNITTITNVVVEHIKKSGQVNVNQSDGRQIVTEFLMNPNYIDLYFTCLCTEQK